ncbi:hypothetical protein D1Y85_08350 [Paraburkholderia dinghuensis]|uniref:Uncharacterized protein n=2 Tax=Paraburkholderia dinghuensis TaxID=2305225 RepID=A0A3N6PYT9_9BURK|nr:hypothetical protein [Paraburkholderia dinghuensis]RQH07590.1 hypothetical protein D1Y85_08350 [Paraburkholderia dinghuensis]
MRPLRAYAFAAAAFALQIALSSAAFAQEAVDPVKALAAPPARELPLKPSPEFAQFPRYVGTLGERQIVMRLAPKSDDPTGVHGEYQFTDTGEVILIAGDRAGSTLEAEESSDGTHITGNWVGTFADDGSLSGDRMEVDDSDPVAFELKPLAAGLPLPVASVAASKAATNAEQAAPAPAVALPSATPAGKGGQPVGGVSNLRTGE